MQVINNIICLYTQIVKKIECFGFPILLLIIRIWMAKIFWFSGLTKISSWASTIYLFTYEYQVPIIPPAFAAYSATGFELLCPILLLFGFATRLAVLPLIVMTAVIQFTYLDLIDHTYWAILLFILLLKGPGLISVDALIKRYVCTKVE